MLSCARVSSSIALTRRSDRTFRGAFRTSPASGAAEPGSMPRASMASEGRSPIWIVSSFSWPSRSTLTETFEPTGVWATRFRNSLTVCTSLPLNSTITSPRCRPAFRAGPCSFTSLTRAPFCSLTLKALARSGVISWMATPSHPRTTFLIKMGKVVRGWLGVAIQEITPDLAKAFKVKEQKGALVSDVNEQGPALKAGLQRGDVIVEFNGKEVQTVSELRNRVAQTPVGSKVSVKVLREGQEKLLTIQIGERPSDAMLARGIEPGSAAPEAGEARKAPLNVLSDLRVKAIDEETRAQLNIGPKTAGVVVAHVQAGSAAEQAGLQRGDVIQEVNRQAITGLKDFEAAAAKIKKDENAVLLVNRQGNSLFIVINP